MVAQVLAPHGIHGELKCRIVTDFPRQRFKRGASVRVRGVAYAIQSARIQGNTVLLKLADISDRTAAETFRGADVEVPVEEAVRLPKGQFYWHEVIGLEVIDTTTNQALGRVRDILETGANDVYIVKSETGREILVPATREVIKEIAPSAGRMLIQPLPGMIPP